jgi:hypothetical protein
LQKTKPKQNKTKKINFLFVLTDASDEMIAKHVLAVGSHAWHPVQRTKHTKIAFFCICLYLFCFVKVGTAGIGRVVDEHLRVKNIAKLRVADSSVR